MRYFYFLRHCTTEFNEAQIVQGACDSPLSEYGRKQADESGNMFSKINFDYAFTGNQERHIETARRILRKNIYGSQTQSFCHPGLNEHDLGFFDKGSEENLYNNASRLYEEKYNLKKGSISTKELLMKHKISMIELSSIFHEMDSTNKTESVNQVKERCLAALKEICHKTDNNSRILIVSSGGTLSILLNALTGQEEDGYIIHHGHCVVIRENCSHFEKIGFYD
ncbi:MAG: histidine phosphatase family protein [Eubacteriales bacterium]|nr:histidine phosphatase family protein [Eubacteriales bacterium]